MTKALVFFLPLSITALSACSAPFSARVTQRPAPLVQSIEVRELGAPPAASVALAERKLSANLVGGQGPLAVDTTTPSSSPMISGLVTLNKSSLFNRLFLYGSDLQYSSVGDKSTDTTEQAMAVGHTLVTFDVLDSTLRMIADQRDQFESDIDHPSRLIATFPIVKQEADTLTIDVSAASPVLNTVIADVKAPAPRTSWVRSVQFVAEGEYLMYETSLEMPDGTIAEFMESVFPRDSVVPKDYKPLFDETEINPIMERFRFLDDSKIFTDLAGKRSQVKLASRFQSPKVTGKTIDWYVTPNIPAEFIPVVKDAIEAWNRYSQKMWGKDLTRFVGPLPAGIKIGDPRFNVVNWDSVAEAGAAYESQAVDPLTGLQSHSLIYLPKAWINIGKEFWTNAGESEKQTARAEALKARVARGSFLGQKLGVTCFEDPSGKISLESRLSPDVFAKELLRGTLFHEVGHSLGLAHNFKGSLSLDPSDNQSSFSTSIMDYNEYQLEGAAFDQPTGWSGPLLEYDRQIISVLYNDGTDISASDLKVPACDDEEADSTTGGVDPLCVRYDAGHDPTQYFLDTIALVKDESAQLRVTRSLPLAIKGLASELKDAVSHPAASPASELAAVNSASELASAIDGKVKELTGVISIYFSSGHQSIASTAVGIVRDLKQFQESTLPADFSESDVRTRAIQGLRYVTTLQSFEPAVHTAIASYKQQLLAWAEASPYYASLGPDAQTAFASVIDQAVSKATDQIAPAITSKLRTTVFKALTATPAAPYAFYTDAKGLSVDFETEVATTLAQAVTQPLTGGALRPLTERLTAAKSLKSFAATAAGPAIFKDAVTAVKLEMKNAHDLDSRNNALKVLNQLTEVDVKPEAAP